MNLTKVLEDPDVQRALAHLRTNPGDDALERKAHRELSSVSSGLFRTDHTVQKVDPTSAKSAGSITGFLFVHDSKGMQIADNATQRNYFTYNVASDVNAARLLAGHEEVRAAIIDSFCSLDTKDPDRTLGSKLSDAIKEDMSTSPELKKFGEMYSWPQAGCLYVADIDGASVGDNGIQENIQAIDVTLGGKSMGPVHSSVDHARVDIDAIINNPEAPAENIMMDITSGDPPPPRLNDPMESDQLDSPRHEPDIDL